MKLNTLARHPLAKLQGGRPAVVGYRKDGRPIHAVAGGAPNPLMERSVDERERCLTLIDQVTAAAFDRAKPNGDPGDLSEQDNETIDRAKQRVEFLDEQIKRLSFSRELSPEAQAAMRSNNSSAAVHSDQPVYRSAGQAMWDLLNQGKDRDARVRLETAMSRAAQHIVADPTTAASVAGGLGALVVKPIVGPVIDPTPKGRPFLTALGVIPLDSPLGFSRPRIVDPVTQPGNAAYGTAPAVQGGEKKELVSRAFDVKLDALDTQTVGEYLNISQKIMALPVGAMQMVLDQFATRRALSMERWAVNEVLETTSTVELVGQTANEDAAPIYNAVWDAALKVWQKTGQLPEWILMGVPGWARLGKLLDKAGRPLFPAIGAVNAMGGGLTADTLLSSGPAGLPSVVTHGITDGTFVVGNSMALEVYEYAYPMLEAIEPSVLGKQVAVASELASYRPSTEPSQTNRDTAGNGAVKIVLDA